MLSRLLVATATILVLGSATPLAAQSAGAPASELRAGPRLDQSVSGIRRPALSSDVEPVLQRRTSSRNQAATLMIVGGVALAVGILVGGDAGDLLVLGGAVVGLVGLYRYLQ